MFDDYVLYLADNELIGTQMKNAMLEADSEDSMKKKPHLMCFSKDNQGYQMYEKKSALNANQFMHEYTKSTQTLRSQPYQLRSANGDKIIFLVERTENMKAKYPTLKIFHGANDEVMTNTGMAGTDLSKVYTRHAQKIKDMNIPLRDNSWFLNTLTQIITLSN